MVPVVRRDRLMVGERAGMPPDAGLQRSRMCLRPRPALPVPVELTERQEPLGAGQPEVRAVLVHRRIAGRIIVAVAVENCRPHGEGRRQVDLEPGAEDADGIGRTVVVHGGADGCRPPEIAMDEQRRVGAGRDLAVHDLLPDPERRTVRESMLLDPEVVEPDRPMALDVRETEVVADPRSKAVAMHPQRTRAEHRAGPDAAGERSEVEVDPGLEQAPVGRPAVASAPDHRERLADVAGADVDAPADEPRARAAPVAGQMVALASGLDERVAGRSRVDLDRRPGRQGRRGRGRRDRQRGDGASASSCHGLRCGGVPGPAHQDGDCPARSISSKRMFLP